MTDDFDTTANTGDAQVEEGPSQVDPLWHRVRPEDTWESIAITHGSTVEALLALSADNPQVIGPESLPVNAHIRVR
ncbi:MAG: LysM peptidoglycan-binding domain-containing protein [Chloroflexi bacterium]|nr:LysM peptidoglycan-binding domain-containing protein [Chloroflexota bacterium]